MTVLTPSVLWAQDNKALFLTIDVKDVKDMKLDVEEKKIKFSGESQGKNYGFEFEFDQEVDKDSLKMRTERLVELCVQKKNQDDEERWERLTSTKLPYVKVDWNKWIESDDEAELDVGGMQGMPGGMGGMGGMPGGMGGMGGMPGMGGMGGMPGMGGDGGGMGGMDFNALMSQMNAGGMGGAGGGGMPDMSQMMAQMGGMGGGAPGAEGGDSDDEEPLPDLDKPMEGEDAKNTEDLD